MTEWVLGVLGGSGLYELGGLEHQQWIEIDTPWGPPSDAVLFAELGGVKLRFLPRPDYKKRRTWLADLEPMPVLIK